MRGEAGRGDGKDGGEGAGRRKGGREEEKENGKLRVLLENA